MGIVRMCVMGIVRMRVMGIVRMRVMGIVRMRVVRMRVMRRHGGVMIGYDGRTACGFHGEACAIRQASKSITLQ